MANANTADFLGGGSAPIARAKVYAPGEQPNPRNPGGISDNALARKLQAQRTELIAKQRADALAATKKKITADNEAKQRAASKGHGVLGDLKAIASPLGKVAKVFDSPLAIALNPTAAIALNPTGKASRVAAAVATAAAPPVGAAWSAGISTADAVNQGKSPIATAATTVSAALNLAGVKAPSVDALKGQAVAGLKALKVDVPDPKKAVAAAKTAAKTATAAASAVKTVKKAAAPTVAAVKKTVTSAAPKVAPPKTAPAKVTITSQAVGLKPPNPKQSIAALAAGAKLTPAEAAKLKGAANVEHLKQQLQAQPVGKKSAAALTSAAALFRPAAAAAAPLVRAAAAAAPAAIKQIKLSNAPPIKAAAPPKPPSVATTTTRPPPSPSVASSSAPAPAAVKPPSAVKGAPAPAAAKGPTVQGYLVKLDGTVDLVTRAWRAA